MDRMFIRLVVFCFCAIFPARLHAQDAIRDLVVKIHASQQGPDLLRPWTKSGPRQVKGSGVVIDGKRILTNAHVVKYASQIYVQPNQSATHIPARIEAIAPGIDLAILKLDDESFFDNRGTLSFAQELPRVSCRRSFQSIYRMELTTPIYGLLWPTCYTRVTWSRTI